MSAPTARGSTIDLTNGVLFQCIPNELGNSADLQAVVALGNKSAANPVVRSGITDPDTDLSTLTPIDLGNYQSIFIYGYSDTTNSTLSIRPIWYDEIYGLIGGGPSLNLVSAGSLADSGNYYCQLGDQHDLWVGFARYVILQVLSILPSGTWTLIARPY